METVPLWVLILALALLILCSAFFAMAETALMAANKYRLRHLAKRGNRAAITTLWLLDRTDKLLSLVLIANTLINAMATALVTAIAILFFGHEESVITIATAVVAFLQFGTIGMATYVSGVSLAITSIEGWLLTPWLTSRTARTNEVAIFVGLIFWSFVWGIWGTLLAVPMLVAVKAYCDHIEDLKPVGELLGE